MTRSKTGSLQPRTFNMDDLKRRSTAPLSKEELEKLDKSSKETENDSTTRLTRQKAHQIATGTHLFKLGMDNTFKSYANQYSTNPIALNKAQRNEERDKKRHLSHKFSLTPVSEFRWVGSLTGNRGLLVNTLRQTILQLESNIQAPFMHTNWPLLRKPWTTAVSTCVNPRDFARALIVLQACIKSVVYGSVWHDQLGHVKLQRVTALEREEKKRQDKKEKKEKEDEEERNRLFNFVKYTLGLKHQVWKQKGEEYRVHGQGGWLWIASSRRYRFSDPTKLGVRVGPQKIMVQVRDQNSMKILALDPSTYEFLINEYNKPKTENSGNTVAAKQEIKDEVTTENNDAIKREVKMENVKKEPTSEGDANAVASSVSLSSIKSEPQLKQETKSLSLSFLAGMKIEKVFTPITQVDEINISKALTTPGRLYYPKIAKKTKIDDFLARRTHLKSLEERELLEAEKTREVMNQASNPKGSADGDTEVDIENHVENNAVGAGGDGPLQGLSGKPVVNKTISTPAKEMLTTIGKRIQQVRTQYANIMKLSKNGSCYSRYCNVSSTINTTKNNAQILTCTCYSPICLQRTRLKRDLVTLLRKANALNNNQTTVTNTSPLSSPTLQKLIIKTEAEDTKDTIKSTVALTHCNEETKNVGTKSTNDIASSPLKKKVKLEESTEKDDSTIVTTNSVSVTTTTTTTTTTTVTTQQQTVKSTSGVVQQQQQERSVTHNSVTVSSMETNTTTSNDGVVEKKVMVNRRGRTVQRTCRTELTADGSVKVYTATSAQGKVYLKKIAITDKKKKRTPVKYPLCSTFTTKNKHRNILLLPQHELRKLSRIGGCRITVQGFHYQAKANLSVWPYPCPRPFFKTCWLYRTVGLKSLAAAAIQLRILWACLRWDDMAAKPLSTDGKSQVTTDTELVTLEILKHRHVGQFLDHTQYRRRKVVIPLELPKQIRGM